MSRSSRPRTSYSCLRAYPRNPAETCQHGAGKTKASQTHLTPQDYPLGGYSSSETPRSVPVDVARHRVCQCASRTFWTVPRSARPVPVHTASHAAVCMPVFPRSGSAPLRCARHMAHMACAMAEPDWRHVGSTEASHLLQKAERPSPPDSPLLGRTPLSPPPSPPPSLGVSKTRWHGLLPAGRKAS